MMEKLIPKLRFSEFNVKWDVEKLGNFADVSKLAGYEFTKHIIYESKGSIIALRGLNIKNNSLNLNDVKYIDNSELSKLKRSKLYIDDLMFTYIGTIGEVALIKENNKFYLAPNVSRIRFNKDIAFPKFMLQQFCRDKFKNKEVKTYVSSSSQPALTMGNVRKFEIAFPPLQEQQKIASFLTDVDIKITELTKKKELLEQYKKGVMQKIFNQEIRFKDENGNNYPKWEEKKLGQVAKFIKGKGLPKSEITKNAKYKCIHYGELFTKYAEKINNIISRTNHNDKTVLSIINDVLMPTSDVTPNGLATASCLKENNVILGGDVLIIRQEIKKIEGVYLAYYIKYFRNDVMKLVSGSTVYHLYGSDMKNLKVLIPCLLEQTKIANFLTDIDNKIEVLSTNIENTQTFKKGLLQQMFV